MLFEFQFTVLPQYSEIWKSSKILTTLIWYLPFTESNSDFHSRVFFVRFCHGRYLFIKRECTGDEDWMPQLQLRACLCFGPLAAGLILCNAHKDLYQMQCALFLFQIVKILCSSFPLRLMKSTTMNPWEPTSTSSSSAWSWLVTDRWALGIDSVYKRLQTNVHKRSLIVGDCVCPWVFFLGLYKT